MSAFSRCKPKKPTRRANDKIFTVLLFKHTLTENNRQSTEIYNMPWHSLVELYHTFNTTTERTSDCQVGVYLFKTSAANGGSHLYAGKISMMNIYA